MEQLDISVTPDDLDGGFIAQVEGQPGIMSQGETPYEAARNAVVAYLDTVAAVTGNLLDIVVPEPVVQPGEAHRFVVTA